MLLTTGGKPFNNYNKIGLLKCINICMFQERGLYNVVQRCTTCVGLKQGGPEMDEDNSSILTCRISQVLKQQVRDFKSKYRLATEKAAIVQLLQVGLFIDTKRNQINDPEIVKYLSANLYSEMLFDWICSLDGDRLDALFGAFKSARDLRYKFRSGERK